MGSGDIQSLADLNNSFEIVRTMNIARITKDAVVQLVVVTIVPMAPLEELLKRLFGVLF